MTEAPVYMHQLPSTADVEAAPEVVSPLFDAGVEALAVCLINADVNPVLERPLAALIRDIAPHPTLRPPAMSTRRSRKTSALARRSSMPIASRIGRLPKLAALPASGGEWACLKKYADEKAGEA
jgi:hypothetical protein